MRYSDWDILGLSKAGGFLSRSLFSRLIAVRTLQLIECLIPAGVFNGWGISIAVVVHSLDPTIQLQMYKVELTGSRRNLVVLAPVNRIWRVR